MTDSDCGLPFFDARLDADGRARPALASRVAIAREGGGAGRAADIDRLRSRIPGLQVDDDGVLGTPKFIRSTRGFLTPPSEERAQPAECVERFVAEFPLLFEIDASEIRLARVVRDFQTEHNGARHLTFQQQIKGVDLSGCEIRANLSRSGELVNIGSTMLARPFGDFKTAPIALADSAAIVIAAANVGVFVAPDGPVSADADPKGPSMRRTWAGLPQFRSGESVEPVTTELVYFPLDRDTIHPAWNVLLPTKGVGHTYEIIVDATDGHVLRRHDRLVWDSTEPVTMRVHTSDSPAPGSPGTATPTPFQYPVVARSLVTWQPADITAWSPSGWINDGDTQTRGNNADAHTDLNGDDVADTPRPSGGPSRVFDFPLDLNQAPGAYSEAAVVQLFYRANWYHDHLTALGFNEAAGNFQSVNFSGQGVAGDAIQLDCQDSASLAPTGTNRNNANFNTGGNDGTSARCQMYVYTGTTPDRDGALDGEIVVHELTHGTSVRLHRGLSGAQPQGLGEGWSDFYALCLFAEPTDDPDGVYPSGAYASYQLGSPSFDANYYFGTRRYPYCTDPNKNPLTYRFIDVGQLSYPPTSVVPRNTAITTSANEVHNIGEVWCTMLVECRARLWHAYGFAGNQRILQLVTDAMKLSPPNPTFIQARDAILQADVLDYAGVDLPMLWAAFAERGLGSLATSPASTSTSGVAESYDIPTFTVFAYPDGLPSRLSPSAQATFRVNVTGSGLSPTHGTCTMHLSINGGAFTQVPLSAVGNNQYAASIPSQPCFTVATFYFSSDTSAGTASDPPTAPSRVYRASTFTSTTRLVTEGFESDTGWMVGPNTATAGLWERGVPQYTLAQPAAAHTGASCFATGLLAGASLAANDVDGGAAQLVSPAFDLSAFGDAVVSYWRWYSNGAAGAPYQNTFRVDVSTDNGSNWTNAETIGPGSPFDPNVRPGWRFASWKLSQIGAGGLTPSSAVKVRFVAEDVSGAVVEAAVDDFTIDGAVCESAAGACCRPDGSCSTGSPASCTSGQYQGHGVACVPDPCACRADHNHSGGLSVQDVFDFLNDWFAGSPTADFNGNGLSIGDVFDFLNAWFLGCQ